MFTGSRRRSSRQLSEPEARRGLAEQAVDCVGREAALPEPSRSPCPAPGADGMVLLGQGRPPRARCHLPTGGRYVRVTLRDKRERRPQASIVRKTWGSPRGRSFTHREFGEIHPGRCGLRPSFGQNESERHGVGA